MSTIAITALFTKNSGAPATGLTLAEIDITLIGVVIATGVETIIWNTQNPTRELTGIGTYQRDYTSANLETNTYYAMAEYVGATVLDSDFAYGEIGAVVSIAEVIPTAIEYTYTVTDSSTGDPIAGVEVWATTDLAGTNIVWRGFTDTFGVTRDVNGNLPRLDPGTYYFWKQLSGYIDVQGPDTEVIS